MIFPQLTSMLKALILCCFATTSCVELIAGGSIKNPAREATRAAVGALANAADGAAELMLGTRRQAPTGKAPWIEDKRTSTKPKRGSGSHRGGKGGKIRSHGQLNQRSGR